MKNYLERNFWLGTRAERLTVTPFENAYWIEEDTGELWGFWFGVWHPLSGVGGGGAVLEGPGIDLVGSQVGLGGDTVLVYDNIGNPVREFATVTLALAASLSGQLVILMPGIYVEDITIPAGVCVVSYGNNSKISGKVTLGGHNSQLNSVVVENIGNSSDPVVAVEGNSSGRGLVNDCSLIATNNGAGDAYGVKAMDGELFVKNSEIESTTNGGGDAYGIYGAGAGETNSNNNIVHATVTNGGNGYDFIVTGSGDMYVTDGQAEATTQPVG